MPKVDVPKKLGDFRQNALSIWDDEGGAHTTIGKKAPAEEPFLTNSELVLMRVRVIALENVIIALLAAGPREQRQLARTMADIISPHAGATQHVLTIRAAKHMNDLVDRAVHIKWAETP